jgi:hypothetical protein
MCDKEVNQMSEQIQALEPRQRRTVGPIIFMIAGIIFLAASIFILVSGFGNGCGPGSYCKSGPGSFIGIVPGWAVALRALSIPSIPIGVMLLLIGLVNTTKIPSIRWLRITVSILCGILLGLAVLWFLLLSVLLISGF